METAALGGAAHLVNFKGTDTIAALVLARDFYDAGGGESPGAVAGCVRCVRAGGRYSNVVLRIRCRGGASLVGAWAACGRAGGRYSNVGLRITRIHTHAHARTHPQT